MKPRNHSSSIEGTDKNILGLLDRINEINLAGFNEELKQKLISDLKSVTLKNWTHQFYSEVKQKIIKKSLKLQKVISKL